MRILAIAGALTLAGGLALAAPAYAGYYDADGVYHPTVYDYYKSTPDYYPNYNYRAPTYRTYGTLSRWEIRNALRTQGYYAISDLHRVAFSDRWVATAYINGDLVRVTVDGDDGRVLYVNEI
jgi:hypothetical protein